MIDARGVSIKVGDSVVYGQQREIERGSWSTMSWGTVTKLNAKMIKIDGMGVDTNKAPHNVVVVALPCTERKQPTYAYEVLLQALTNVDEDQLYAFKDLTYLTTGDVKHVVNLLSGLVFKRESK